MTVAGRRQQTLALRGVTADVFAMFVEFAYTGDIKLTDNIIEPLLEAAMQLEVIILPSNFQRLHLVPQVLIIRISDLQPRRLG